MAWVTVPVLAGGSAISTVTPVNGPWEWWNAGYCQATVTSSTTSQMMVWQQWNSTTGTPYLYPVSPGTVSVTMTLTVPQWQSWNARYEETAEQCAAREAAQAARRAEQERYQAARLAATSRAEQLLMSLLTEQQARTYIEHGWFEVRGSKGGRWRIRNRGQAGNVDLMPDIGDERDTSFCCHPPGGLPAADAHLAQMLHLVTDEDDFRRTANIAYRRPVRVAA